MLNITFVKHYCACVWNYYFLIYKKTCKTLSIHYFIPLKSLFRSPPFMFDHHKISMFPSKLQIRLTDSSNSSREREKSMFLK